MAKRIQFLETWPDRASAQFGGLRQLPPVQFRGADCRDLAELYRRARALLSIEPTLPDLLSVGAERAPRKKGDASG
jgi:hypothetical protein